MSLFRVQGLRWWERGEEACAPGRFVSMYDRDIDVVREQVIAIESISAAMSVMDPPHRHAVLVFASGQRLEVDTTPEVLEHIFR